jgi:hypothetical protein
MGTPQGGYRMDKPSKRNIIVSLEGNLGRTYGQTFKTAQEKNARYYDRKVMTPPDFKVGDLVMIDARNMKTKRPSKKLDHKKIGPVKILKKIGTRAFRVELPTTIEVHNVFHVSLLEPYRKSKVPGRHQPSSATRRGGRGRELGGGVCSEQSLQ